MKRVESSALAEKQRHDEYLAFKRSETENNRAHEIELLTLLPCALLHLLRCFLRNGLMA